MENVLDCVDEDLAVDLTRDMVRMRTANPPGDEILLARMLRERTSALGLDARLYPFDSTRANLVCRIPGSGELPSVVFSGHLDTVPFGEERWEHGPLSGDIADGRIFGRGSADMKGGVAAMIAAAAAVRRSGLALRGDLVLALTAGEEVDCIGANRMVGEDLLAGAGCLIVAEPTDMDVCIAEKGALWIEVLTRGKAAHGSTPHLGRNAVIPMAGVIRKLAEFSPACRRHPLLGGSTMNIGTIKGGTNTNIVPDRCSLTIDFRTVPGQDHQSIFRSVRELMEESMRESAHCDGIEWDLRILGDRPPVDTAADDPFVEIFARAARQVLGHEPTIAGVTYFTDGAILAQALRAPMVICGPGEASAAHQADESVKIDNLRLAARTYALAAASLLQIGIPLR